MEETYNAIKEYEDKKPIPDNYMQNSGFPQGFIKKIRESGWVDKDGNINFPNDLEMCWDGETDEEVSF